MRADGRAAASGLVRIGLASVFFGIASVFIRLAYDHGANVAAVLAVRSIAVLPWLAAFALERRRANVRAVWPQLVPMGLLTALNVFVFAVAISRMSPALVALIYYAYPILVIAGAHVLGWSRFEALTALAALATLTGVALTIGLPEGAVDPLAVALSLLNAAGYAAYLLLAESALRRCDAATCFALVVAVSSALLLAGSVAAGIDLPESGAGLASLGALFASLFLPHVLLLGGLGRLGGPWGSIVSCLEVVTTVAATALVLGLPLGPGVIVGGALIILGGVAAPIVASGRGRLAAERVS
jgi:drug/metabolite transporter (DMT)-like permease